MLHHSYSVRRPKDDTKLSRSKRKYGWENFQKNILLQCQPDKTTLNYYERKFVYMYDTCKNGLNSTEGGDGLPDPTPETRAKISKKAKIHSITGWKKGRKNRKLGKITKLKRLECTVYQAGITYLGKFYYLGTFKKRTAAEEAIRKKVAELKILK